MSAKNAARGRTHGSRARKIASLEACDHNPAPTLCASEGRVSASVFVRGAILVPVAGTVRWGPGGAALGIWGDRRNPVIPHLLEADGTVREANEAEVRMIEAIWGRW